MKLAVPVVTADKEGLADQLVETAEKAETVAQQQEITQEAELAVPAVMTDQAELPPQQ